MNIEEFRTHCLAVKGSEESKNIRNTVHLRTTGRGMDLLVSSPFQPSYRRMGFEPRILFYRRERA